MVETRLDVKYDSFQNSINKMTADGVLIYEIIIPSTRTSSRRAEFLEEQFFVFTALKCFNSTFITINVFPFINNTRSSRFNTKSFGIRRT